MNRIIFSSLLISLLSFGLYGQNAKSHKAKINEKCIVMGVDINCPISIGMQRFEQKGFVIADNDKHILKGQFLNRSVAIQLTSGKENKFIGWVTVFFGYEGNKPFPSWSILKDNLKKISDELRDVYGVDYVSSFKFASPYKDGDGNEFLAICSEKADVFTALYPNKDGVLMIKSYPTSFSSDQMLIIMHFYNERAGLGDLN